MIKTKNPPIFHPPPPKKKKSNETVIINSNTTHLFLISFSIIWKFVLLSGNFLLTLLAYFIFSFKRQVLDYVLNWNVRENIWIKITKILKRKKKNQNVESNNIAQHCRKWGFWQSTLTTVVWRSQFYATCDVFSLFDNLLFYSSLSNF